MKYLDNNGLLYLWQKIKTKINSSGLLNESVIGWNKDEIPPGYEEIENPNEVRLTRLEEQVGNIGTLLDTINGEEI